MGTGGAPFERLAPELGSMAWSGHERYCEAIDLLMPDGAMAKDVVGDQEGSRKGYERMVSDGYGGLELDHGITNSRVHISPRDIRNVLIWRYAPSPGQHTSNDAVAPTRGDTLRLPHSSAGGGIWFVGAVEVFHERGPGRVA